MIPNETEIKKEIIVTTSWDDGHKCDLILKKLLDEYNIKGTFYPTPNYLIPMTNDELLIIDQHHEIGAHTLNHPILTEIQKKFAWEEIMGSKKNLEDILGHPINMFCYPFGKYDNEIKDLIKKAGFIAARTCQPGDFSKGKDPFEWHITLHASNGSPRLTFNLWKKNHLLIQSLFDWEIRAKMLFDKALQVGGIYHIWGHSWEFEQKNEWDKLERVFKYIANRKNVLYKTNSQIFLEDI
jgi:peptidoglycan-N-acetylglucosamine deacetylase